MSIADIFSVLNFIGLVVFFYTTKVRVAPFPTSEPMPSSARKSVPVTRTQRIHAYLQEHPGTGFTEAARVIDSQ